MSQFLYNGTHNMLMSLGCFVTLGPLLWALYRRLHSPHNRCLQDLALLAASLLQILLTALFHATGAVARELIVTARSLKVLQSVALAWMLCLASHVPPWITYRSVVVVPPWQTRTAAARDPRIEILVGSTQIRWQNAISERDPRTQPGYSSRGLAAALTPFLTLRCECRAIHACCLTLGGFSFSCFMLLGLQGLGTLSVCQRPAYMPSFEAVPSSTSSATTSANGVVTDVIAPFLSFLGAFISISGAAISRKAGDLDTKLAGKECVVGGAHADPASQNLANDKLPRKQIPPSQSPAENDCVKLNEDPFMFCSTSTTPVAIFSGEDRWNCTNRRSATSSPTDRCYTSDIPLYLFDSSQGSLTSLKEESSTTSKQRIPYAHNAPIWLQASCKGSSRGPPPRVFRCAPDGQTLDNAHPQPIQGLLVFSPRSFQVTNGCRPEDKTSKRAALRTLMLVDAAAALLTWFWDTVMWSSMGQKSHNCWSVFTVGHMGQAALLGQNCNFALFLLWCVFFSMQRVPGLETLYVMSGVATALLPHWTVFVAFYWLERHAYKPDSSQWSVDLRGAE